MLTRLAICLWFSRPNSAVGRILESDISNRVFVEYKYSTYILNLHLFQFRKLGIQLFHALFAEVDG